MYICTKKEKRNFQSVNLVISTSSPLHVIFIWGLGWDAFLDDVTRSRERVERNIPIDRD